MKSSSSSSTTKKRGEPLMIFKTGDAKTMHHVFEVLKDCITETLIHFHPDSIRIRAGDITKTNLVFVELIGSNLDKYECAKYQSSGVHVSRLWTVIKKAGVGNLLELTIREKEEDDLGVTIYDSNGSIIIDTMLKTIRMEDEAMLLPDNITFDSCISMSSLKFYDKLKTLEDMEYEFVKIVQGVGPNGNNRLQFEGVGSQYHKSTILPVAEIESNQHVADADNAEKNGQPGWTATATSEDNAAAIITTTIITTTTQSAHKLPEVSHVFQLKKLVQFAKAKSLDHNVSIHLDPEGFLVLQYKIKIYGDLKFIVLSAQQPTEEFDDEVDSDDADDNNDNNDNIGENENNGSDNKRDRNDNDDDDDAVGDDALVRKKQKNNDDDE